MVNLLHLLVLAEILLKPFDQIYFERTVFAHVGPWKKKCLSNMGIVTQCMSPGKISDQYLTNVLLKINTKVMWADLTCKDFILIFSSDFFTILFVAWRDELIVSNRTFLPDSNDPR